MHFCQQLAKWIQCCLNQFIQFFHLVFGVALVWLFLEFLFLIFQLLFIRFGLFCFVFDDLFKIIKEFSCLKVIWLLLASGSSSSSSKRSRNDNIFVGSFLFRFYFGFLFTLLVRYLIQFFFFLAITFCKVLSIKTFKYFNPFVSVFFFLLI